MKAKQIIVVLFTVGVIQACGSSFGDDEHDYWKRQPGVAPVTNAKYKAECGSCHFAYQPGLLPEQSWKKIMSGLDNHFGDNAELDPAVKTEIQDYLVNNSADKSSYRRSQKIMRYLKDSSAPLRISELHYIKRRHHEIPSRLITGNDKVGSLSHCDACHQSIDQGSFSERQIKIPGYGRWDD